MLTPFPPVQLNRPVANPNSPLTTGKDPWGCSIIQVDGERDKVKGGLVMIQLVISRRGGDEVLVQGKLVAVLI